MRKVAAVNIVIGLWMVLACVMSAHGADTVTVAGEVIDTYCFSLMGAKGESHRQCAINCVKAGIPAGLLEDGTNKIYVLLSNKENAGLPKSVIDKLGRKATITGKVYAIGGSQFLTVESVK
jgi:hypothetical protein